MPLITRGGGFTLIEILLVVGALAVLAGMTIIAINPSKQLASAHDSVRRSDVASIWAALHHYALDHHGEVPSHIPLGTLADCTGKVLDQNFTICRSDGCSLTLTELTADDLYLNGIPVDPTSHTDDYSGYNVIRDINHENRLTVCAPAAEEGGSIYVPE